jgi:hypothetical protein
MAKKVQAYIKLQVKAGEANPSPPVGPALGNPFSIFWVFALNDLQNSIIFTPC